MELRRFRGRSRTWVRTQTNRQSLRLGRFIAHVRKTPGSWYLAEVYFTGDRECVVSAVEPTIDDAKRWAYAEVRSRYEADRPPPEVKRAVRDVWWKEGA